MLVEKFLYMNYFKINVTQNWYNLAVLIIEILKSNHHFLSFHPRSGERGCGLGVTLHTESDRQHTVHWYQNEGSSADTRYPGWHSRCDNEWSLVWGTETIHGSRSVQWVRFYFLSTRFFLLLSKSFDIMNINMYWTNIMWFLHCIYSLVELIT